MSFISDPHINDAEGSRKVGPRLATRSLVHGFARHLFTWFLGLGPFGLVILGILDSSFLVLPFGNDILLVVLVARNHAWFPIYVTAAAVGSMLGVLLLDFVCRKGGEEGLRRLLKPARFDQLKNKLDKRAGAALMVACLAPPPFPFTAVVAAASAFQYPRKHLLAVILAGRALRFSFVGVLALIFGRGVLRFIRSDVFTWFVGAFAAVCLVASAASIVRWIRHTRAPLPRVHRPAA